MKLTNLDFAILGLLSQRSNTGYGIRKIFETTAMGNYSSSPGSIYPAIKRLSKGGFVESKPTVTDSGVSKDILEITQQGTESLVAWLTEPLSIEMVSKGSEILILKFAFTELISKEQKVSFLQSFLELTEAYLESLQAYNQSDQGSQLPMHGRLSFEFGLASLETKVSWLKSTLKTIETNN